jgi:tripartite-type tricarboxylate transporter receptor subunit TctC
MLVLLFCSIDAGAQAPCFQGKTIRFVIGYPPDSSRDLWARLVSSHLTKHIAGNPNVIFQNMPGVGSGRGGQLRKADIFACQIRSLVS